ncbi:ABC transporter permease [Candidatus Pacearchaeota archaeon]|nr:ABC transporter permease [Candidatus Pacearchaeota archaeon]
MLKDYFSLAIGNLRHRGLRSWLTIFGIFIGIAAVVSLITMGQGLQTAITGQFGSLSVDKLTIQNKQTGFAPPGSAVVEKLNEHDLNVIKSVSGVDKVITRWIRVTSIEYNKVSKFIYIADLPSDNDGTKLIYDTFQAKADQGKLLSASDRGKILLGSNFADANTFDKEIRAGSKIKINGKSFEVAGILKPTSTFTINGAILMPHEDMKNLLSIGDEYDLIVVQVQDKNKIQDVAEELERKLRNDRNEKLGEESFTVETPLQALESVNNVLNVVNLVVIGIAAISLFVGGVGIANTMYTSVLDRTREIGTMKAVGAKNKDILMIFLIESGLLGFVGALIGIILGVGIGKGIEYIAINQLNTNLLRVATPAWLIFGCLMFGFLIGAISGLLPARSASRVNVVDALRYE